MTLNLGIRKYLREWLMQGNQVLCPCCQKSFLAFWPNGKPVRYNAQCPHCSAFERHRLVALFLQQQPHLLAANPATKAPCKLLHIAPELVFYSLFKKNKAIDYYPADKFMPGYKYPKGTHNIDICNMHHPKHSFDAILCNHVLEHIPDHKKALSELYRVLRPGGWAILQVPINYANEHTLEDEQVNTPQLREKIYGQHDHLRLYGRDYPQVLQASGFSVSCFNIHEQFSEDEIKQYGLDLNDPILYFCTKTE